MPTYQEQHPTGIGASIRNFLNSFVNRARNNYSNYLPNNIQSSLSSSPLRTSGRVASAVLNPVGTAMNEAARSGWQALGDTREQNAYNNYANELLMADPAYARIYGNAVSTGGQASVAGTAPRSNANAYLTGNFQQRPANNNPLVNLNYGQNGQEVQMQGGGLPGITGPNIYAGRQSGTPSMGSFMGRTPGTASMSQISEMLMSGGRGRGERPLFSPHEINEERARAKALGLTLAEARRQGQ